MPIGLITVVLFLLFCINQQRRKLKIIHCLLDGQPRTGRRIKKECGFWLDWYPQLYHLENDGFIESKPYDNNGRRVYNIKKW